jgi:hypothetical protein
MLYLLIVLIGILFLMRRLSPMRLAVHASRADGLPKEVPIKSRWITAGFARDEHGEPIALAGRFIGMVAGSSMTNYGMPPGATFVGDELKSFAEKRTVRPGDIVVIDAPAAHSPVGLRLRRVKAIRAQEGTLEFENGSDGRTHNPRPYAQIRARVTHVFASPDANIEPRGVRLWLAKSLTKRAA